MTAAGFALIAILWILVVLTIGKALAAKDKPRELLSPPPRDPLRFVPNQPRRTPEHDERREYVAVPRGPKGAA